MGLFLNSIVATVLIISGYISPDEHHAAIANYRDGLKALHNNNIEQANDLFLAAVKNNPEWGHPQLEVAYTMRLLGYSPEERQLYSSVALQKMPHNPRAYYEAALVARDSGQQPEAIDLLRQCLLIREEYDMARLELAHLLLNDGQYQEALNNYQLLEDRLWQNSSLQLGIVTAARQLGLLDVEENALRTLLQLSGRNQICLQRMRDFYQRSGDEEKQALIEAELHQRRLNQEHRPQMRPLPKSSR